MSEKWEKVILPKFSVGVGDRFAHQAKAQLSACLLAAREGVEVVPVWNKSNREHLIIGSEPDETRRAADAAVRELGWDAPYFVDADHINLNTVGRYIVPCDFFTLDVADESENRPIRKMWRGSYRVIRSWSARCPFRTLSFLLKRIDTLLKGW